MKKEFGFQIKNIMPKKSFFVSIVVLTSLCFVCGKSSISLELLSYQKQKANSSVGCDTFWIKKCMNWHLDSLSILEIFQSSEFIPAGVWNVCCSILPCEYAGEVIINGIRYNYGMNAGGCTTIWNKDTTIFLGYDDIEYKFFLEDMWKEEMDE